MVSNDHPFSLEGEGWDGEYNQLRVYELVIPFVLSLSKDLIGFLNLFSSPQPSPAGEGVLTKKPIHHHWQPYHLLLR